MKKTHSANIGGTIFNVEEDAYSRLAAYLESIEAHFRAYPDSADIVTDIEGRIAEQFLSGKSGSAQNIVTLADVERVIAAMGTAEEFGDADSPSVAPAQQATTRQERKLFRDADDRIIAGVASGIAAYFGISVLLVRLIFLFLLFVGGSSIFVYLLLWLLVPTAKTTTDKLKMRGDPVTLESVERGVRDSIAAISPAARSSAPRLAVMIGSVIRGFVIAMAWIVGIAIVIMAAIALLALTMCLVVALVNPEMLSDVERAVSVSDVLGGMYYPLVISTYLIFAVPLFSIIMLAINRRRGKRGVSTKVGVGMFGIFLVSLLFSMTIWATFYPDQPFRFFHIGMMMTEVEDDLHTIEQGRTNVDTTISVEANPVIDLSLL